MEIHQGNKSRAGGIMDTESTLDKASEIYVLTAKINALIDQQASFERHSREFVSKQDLTNTIEEFVPREIRGSKIVGAGSVLVMDHGYAAWGNVLEGDGSENPSSSSFSGTYYFKGKLYELTGTQLTYWYHNAKTGSGSWSNDPMPDPMPDSMYWRKTSTCKSVEYIMC